MTVRFERSGGVAGVRLTAALDTALLPPAQARRLQKLVQTAAFFDQPRSLRSKRPGPDRFSYRVTVEEVGRQWTIELDEGAMPALLRPLIDYLTAAARNQPKK